MFCLFALTDSPKSPGWATPTTEQRVETSQLERSTLGGRHAARSSVYKIGERRAAVSVAVFSRFAIYANVVRPTDKLGSGRAESISGQYYCLLLVDAFSWASRARSLARRAVRARFAIAARAFSPFCRDIFELPTARYHA